MNQESPRTTLMATASDWNLFRSALGDACPVSESEFRHLAVPERLRHLVAQVGAEHIEDEINASLERLGVKFELGIGGFGCSLKPKLGGAAIGWDFTPLGPPVWRLVDPCLALSSLVRLESRIKAGKSSRNFWDLREKVRRIINRSKPTA